MTILSSYDGNPPTVDPVVEMDTIEPRDFPTALPDDGETYPTAQQVAISAHDEADQERTHFTVGTPYGTRRPQAQRW